VKVCNVCKENKPLTEFYSQKKQSKKRGEYIYYNPECKACTIKRSRNMQLENHEEYLEYTRQHHKWNRKHNRKMIEYDRKHAREQKDSGYSKEYYLKNKEYFSNYNKERLANKTHEITDSEWVNCKGYFNNSCAYCEIHMDDHYIVYAGELKKTDLHKEHVDHKGSNKLDNCVPSCQMCNSSKWAFTLEEWYNEDNPKFNYDRLSKIHSWLNGDYKLYISN